MIVDLHSADACERESSWDRCAYPMEVGWEMAHDYAPVVERGLSSKRMRGEVALGLNIARGEIVRLERCGYAMNRSIPIAGLPEVMAVWVGEVVKAHVGVGEPRIRVKMTAGDRTAPEELDSQVSAQWDFAPEIAKGKPWAV